MGNLSFLIPTKKVNEFTLDNVLALVKKNFPENNSFKLDGFEQLRFEDTEEELICEMWKDDCYLLDDIDEDIENAEENDEIRYIKYYQELKKANLDKDNCIQVNYGWNHKERNEIIKFIGKEFGCYWLDEGIHPEFSKY